MADIETAHMVWRIGGPALAADIVVEAAIAVGENVEPSEFLVAQIAGERVFILLAKAAADHGFEKVAGAEIFGVPARPRQRASDSGRQFNVFGRSIHCRSPRCRRVVEILM